MVEGGLQRWARVAFVGFSAYAVAGAIACSDRIYVCESDTQCVWQGRVGQCVPEFSVCAYPDDDCASMLRFGPYAGVFARECVEPETTMGSSSSGIDASTSATGDDESSEGSTGSTGGDDPPIPLPPITGDVWYVSPEGNDEGEGTVDDPFATLQRGLEAAMPGDGVELADGDYEQGAVSVRDGLADAPIIVYGSADAVLHEPVADDVLRIEHDHHVIHGISIDGLHGDPKVLSDYTDQLVVVRGRVEGAKTIEPVLAVRLLELNLRRAADECVRLVDHARDTEVAGCTIVECGVRDNEFGGTGKNGEGIYIGTSDDQWGETGPDESRDNWIHDNTIDTRGNECVDVQEGATLNLIEDNTCTGLRDADSGGISIRGNANTVRGNLVEGGEGAGVRLGGDDAGGVTYGVDNEVTGNDIRNNAGAGVKIEDEVQGAICGNVLEGNGSPTGGMFGELFEPADPC